MATSSPLCSVIITTFRLPASLLRDCVDSVIDQTETRWEAIVVDDGSADDVAEEVISGSADPRIRLVRHGSNRGLGAARNTGIAHARAALVVPVDGDDRLDPRFLGSLSDALEAHPEAAWAFADWQCFGASVDEWRFPVPPPPPCPEHMLIPGAGTLMRRHVWDLVGGYLEDAGTSGIEDWDFWIGAMEQGLAGVHLPVPLYLHRRHGESMSVTTSIINDHAIREMLYRRHRQTFDRSGACPRCPPKHRVATFRSRGYVNSSVASLSLGHRIRAIRLATWAVRLRPDRLSIRQLLRTLLPRRTPRTQGPSDQRAS